MIDLEHHGEKPVGHLATEALPPLRKEERAEGRGIQANQKKTYCGFFCVKNSEAYSKLV